MGEFLDPGWALDIRGLIQFDRTAMRLARRSGSRRAAISRYGID